MAKRAQLASFALVSKSLPSCVLLIFAYLLVCRIQRGLAVQVPRYEFQIEFYDTPALWQKCPDGWRKHSQKCVKLFFTLLSWEDASKVCKSHGGYLVEIWGFNQNIQLGWLLQEALFETYSQQQPISSNISISNAAIVSSQRLWIGMKRTGNGRYTWSSGKPGTEKQGFWDKGSPPSFSSNSTNVIEKCCDINLVSTEYGQFRWSLAECDEKRHFVCEVAACNIYQYRCLNGLKCVSGKSICDGIQDCDDGSDEQQCQHGSGCGGSMKGENGTFQSPGYPGRYPSHSNCIWHIQAPLGTKVQLQLQSFDVESKYDFVEVYDGSERQASALLGHYSGTSIPVINQSTSNFLLVVFTSDRSIESSGFKASWSAVQNDGLTGSYGGELKAQQSVQWFTSPLFPSNYPDNLACDWTITAPGTSDIISLQFHDFELEDIGDWVEVFNNKIDSSMLLGRFSGAQLPQVIVSSSPKILVRLKTDSGNSRRGFNASYSVGCSIDILSGYARFASPGFGVTDYPHSLDCIWRIFDPSQRKLNLVFDPDFNTEINLDNVKVYNTSKALSSSLASDLSGTLAPSAVRSTAGAFVVTFHSDSSVQRRGWTAAVSYDCEPLPVQPPLEVSSQALIYGSTVYFSCQEGYILNGTNFTICDLQADWKPSILPSCNLVDCKAPKLPNNGYVKRLTGTVFGSVVTYTCNKGYYLKGANTSVCQQDGWSAIPECQEIYCPKELPPMHGKALAEENTYGALREYFCDAGYRMVGAKFSYCTLEGKWTSPVPECHFLQCPAIAGIVNGSVEPSGPVNVGDVVVITCESGYQLIGHSKMTCLDFFNYSQPVPYCIDVDECEMTGRCTGHGLVGCQNLQGSFRCLCQPGYDHPADNVSVCEDVDECATENGGCSHRCRNKAGSYECYCDDGYVLYQGPVIVVNGGQLVTNKSCIVPCPGLNVTGGMVVYTGPQLSGGLYLSHAQAVVACPAGTMPDGPSRLQCLDTGIWSANVTTCQRAICFRPDTPDHGQVELSGQEIGSSAMYSCEEGFHLHGPAKRYCQSQVDNQTWEYKLSWTGRMPTCQPVDCGVPPEIANGVVHYATTTIGSLAIYLCNCGYELPSQGVRTCQTNGFWSGSNIQCTVQHCSYPGRPLYGSMVTYSDVFPVGMVVRYKCDRPGYQLSDPWPIKCLPQFQSRVSIINPVYRVSVSLNFTTMDDTVLTSLCRPYYQKLVLKHLREFIPRLCMQNNQFMITISNSSDIFTQESNFSVTAWFELARSNMGTPQSVCQCGQELATNIQTVLSLGNFPFLVPSLELDCSPASLLKETVRSEELGWTCPTGLKLTVPDDPCGQGVIACVEECVSLVPPVTKTTMTAVKSTTTAPSSAMTPQTTTAAKFNTTTPQTTAVTSSAVPVTSRGTTVASPLTTAFTLPKTSTSIATSSAGTTAAKTSAPTTTSPAPAPPTTTLPLTTQTNASLATSPTQTTKAVTEVLTTAAISSETTTSSTVALPQLLMEVEDYLAGNFTNITCVDEVHKDINKKVNEVLRDFNNMIGKDTCKETPAVGLKLSSGNISFKRQQASIFMQFSMTSSSTNATKTSVENCSLSFVEFIVQSLPSKFSLVSQVVVPKYCTNVMYTVGSINVTRKIWSCPAGYQLTTLNANICERLTTTVITTSPTATTTPSSTTPPVPVSTVPRMIMTFLGTMVKVSSGSRKELESCLPEYVLALTKVLGDLESGVQTTVASSCANIFVGITSNVSLSVHDANRVQVTADATLFSLSEWISHSALNTCASTVQTTFYQPSVHLPNLTVPDRYLKNCTSLLLNPDQLTEAKSPTFSCPDLFVYDAQNFICVAGNTPSLMIQINLTITGLSNNEHCRNAVQTSASVLSNAVEGDLLFRLNNKLICSLSERVVLLPKNSQLLLSGDKGIISLPLTLLSIHGLVASVENCRNQVYSQLSMMLTEPVQSLKASIKQACPAAIEPANFTRDKEIWMCFEGWAYNTQNQICDRVVSESSAKTKGLMSERRKRDTTEYNQNDKPYWNTTLPFCQDQEAPVFTGCPKTSVEVQLGPNGPVPVDIHLPTVSDNSNAVLIISYQPPDFQLPFKFRQNMTVNITATDLAGNQAVCRISVVLVDVTPPAVLCPAGLHRQHYSNGSSDLVAVVYSPDLVTIADNSGISRIDYSPAPGSLVEVLKKFNVVVTAVDFAGNRASCTFVYVAESDRCSLENLPVPAEGKGQRICTSESAGSVAFGISCQLSCPQNYVFITLPPVQYVCLTGGVWNPNTNVPLCGALQSANFNFNMTLNFSYDGSADQNCADAVGNSINNELKSIYIKTCQKWLSRLDVTIDHMGIFQWPFFNLKVRVSITVVTPEELNSTAKDCGSSILSQVQGGLELVRGISGCGNTTFQPPADSDWQTTCPSGFAVYNYSGQKYCLECPEGSYFNASHQKCEACPVGYYQNGRAQFHCFQCPASTSTLSTGAKTVGDCLVICSAGYWSPSGLSPCWPCNKGEYQTASKETRCIACPDGQSTAFVSSASPSFCRNLCQVGYYSSDGLEPCSPCPLHHFTETVGAKYCFECPPERSTLKTGSSSISDCIVVDWCRQLTCVSGSTCVDRYRFAQCLCPPGSTGVLCQDKIEQCSSSPCVNGGVCVNLGSNYSCQCTPGFTGKNCEVDTDECSSSPCLGGVCIDGSLSFRCLCNDGYTGERCENDIDDCKTKPCNNGGHCLDLVAGFACDCSGTGYEGSVCERRIDVCSDEPCLNGGTCQDRLNGFICMCAPGFTGDLCEVNTNDCEPDLCSNGAVCVDGVHSFSCICQPGFTGSLCNSDIDECSSAPCLNHGNCTNLVNDYLCTCLDGYKGRNCEQYSSKCSGNACNISGTQKCQESNNNYTCICLPNWRGVLCDVKANPCDSSPCADSATCTPLADTFVCSCPPDFTGTLCNHRLDDCVSGPCMNNGTCIDGVHSYRCACRSGFTGSMCEQNINECASFPCKNGSVCKDTIGGYICICALGFEGDTCNINIDDCSSQPCANGGICKDKVGGFKCNCTKGFTGRTCAEDINECAVSPCQNGATCVNTVGSYLCECSSQYQGRHCEIDECPLENICLNNSTCRSDSGGTIVCSCPDLYTGADCGKEKSGDFDLQFYGEEGSASSTSNFSMSLASHFAVCLWVRCGAVNTDDIFLSVRRADISSGNSMLLSMSRSTVSVALKGETEPRRYSLSIATGVWHHVCYQWHGTQHETFLDGIRIMTETYGVGVTLPERLILTLGQQSSSNFQGEISQTNIFSVPLNQSQVLDMAVSCIGTQAVGNLFAWPSADVHLVGLVKVVSPSNCGKSDCPPGFSGIACDLEIDKVAPSVVSCPPDKIITDSNSAMVIVQWEEPVFEDNVGIASILQTHRSGQAFRQGEYIVTYVAYDAENNSAECSFEIIIRPSGCIEPLPPANGVVNCGSWEHGIHCSAACLPLYSFVEQLPPYYTCGKLGFWDPPRGSPFRFPPCARKLHPNVTLVGVVSVRGPACTNDYKADLKVHFSLIMTSIHTSLGLCKAELCDIEKGLLVTCDSTGLARTKRETDAVFQVAVNLNISMNSISAMQGTGNGAAEKLMAAVKARQFDTSNFTVDPASSQLSVDFKCGVGQVLRVLEQENFTRICLDCPVGYYYNGTVGDCQPCPEGSYSSQPKQESCTPCPKGTATSAPGAASLSSCLKLCDAGSYYVQSSGQCMLCPRGQYQGVAGQTSCLNCPIGQSTDQPGATVARLCKNICQKGQEINVSGECSPCPQGLYQEDANLPVCKPCPYGWTTPAMGSISVNDCSVVVCEKGHRRVASNNTCGLCPVGTYQTARGADHCIPCGVQMSTSSAGATSQSQCHSGPVNECLLLTHNCHHNAYCIDTEDKFICKCKTGYSGDGTNCTDLCENFCDNDGECAYGANGDPVCSCRLGSSGLQCENQNKMPAALSSAMTGGIAGSVVAVFVIIVFAAICCWRHRTERKMTHDRIYRSNRTQYRAAAAGFYNEGYQTVRERIPSQMIVHEQSSSTSSSSSFTMAARWNRSTFANSDEDEMDACWFESFPMDDLSLGSDAFTRINRAAEAEAYF